MQILHHVRRCDIMIGRHTQGAVANKGTCSPFLEWRLERLKRSINTSRCLVHLRLIKAKFVNYNSWALFPHVSTLCVIEVIAHDEISQAFPLLHTASDQKLEPKAPGTRFTPPPAVQVNSDVKR